MRKTPIRFFAVAFTVLFGAGMIMCSLSGCKSQPKHEPWTQELIDALEKNPQAKALLVEAIDIAKSINPDPQTNPAQTLEEYYAYLDWSAKCLPWSVVPQPIGSSLYDKIDQSVDYIYFLLDMPLEQL